MSLFNCECKRSCALTALVVSVIVGVITAFLQITAVITVAPVFLWVAFGIAIVYLGVLVVAAALARRREIPLCCSTMNTLLAGILGTVGLSVLLLAVGITATSVISAILVGLLLLFLTLMLTATACLVKCLTDCEG